jgi:S1-C subfamily serine protease
VVGAVVAASATLVGVQVFDRDDATTVVQAAPARFETEPLNIPQLVEQVGPSVVSIELGRAGEDQVFDVGAGSGVIIDDAGLVLTNAHVVEGADTISVRLADGREVRADLVGASTSNDVALVRLREAGGLQPAVLGSSAALRVGDQVVAIGNALGLGDTPSVTTGIVSATGRTLSDGDVTLGNLIQTDAAINRGNSGGPLLNSLGEVVGINTAGIPAGENLGFAIEIDAVRPLIDELAGGGGEVAGTAFLGISSIPVAELTDAERGRLGVPDELDGVVVTSVQPGSAAADAALQVGDVIISIDGTSVTSTLAVRELISARDPGDRVVLDLVRGGATQTVDAVLGSRAVTG